MRVPDKGLIDRSKPVAFTFDGKTYHGFAGDTLASALLANGVTLMGRSFKYHRPRGVLTAGLRRTERPGRGARRRPADPQHPRHRAGDLRRSGRHAARTAGPRLRWDLLSVNDLAAPFLGAGFYYKTFMWPRAFWEKLYEPADPPRGGSWQTAAQT